MLEYLRHTKGAWPSRLMPDSIQRRFRLRLLAALLVCLALAYVAGISVYVLAGEVGPSLRRGQPPGSQVLWEAWRRIESDFYGPLPSVETRTYGAIRGSLELLDPYTVFLEPESRELEEDELRGSFGGIGVTLWQDGAGRIAIDPFPASPAERAGAREGDVLVAIDGEEMGVGTMVRDVEAKLHGEAGTPVTVTLSRPGVPRLDLTITREIIETPSVAWRVETGGIGYIGMSQFTERTADEVAAALEGLQQRQASELILDLRGNAGGLVDSAVGVASLFLAHGKVVVHERSRGGEKTLRARGGQDVALPMVVLVDERTASAAEMLAGALQDHERAVLMGTETFGKGSVQEIYGLANGSSVHVTTAVWLTPARREIDGRGLTPDITIRDRDEPGDEQLQRAVSYLALE